MGWFSGRSKGAGRTRAARSRTKPVEEWEANPAPVSWSMGDPTAIAYEAALDSGDWRAVREVLVAAPPATRAAVIGWSRFDAVPIGVGERWVTEAPDDPVGALIRGYLGVQYAWEARGRDRARTVSADSFATFFERLRLAEEYLERAARDLPKACEPWIGLLVSGRGLQIPLEEITTRFDAAQGRSAWQSAAVHQMLQSLCAKWYGSNDLMFTFARMVATEAPPGSAAIGVLAMAYMEDIIEHHTASCIDGAEAQAELDEAAERSIFHPDFVADLDGLGAVNKFVAAFWLGDNDNSTYRAIKLLEGRYSPSPLEHFFENPGEKYRMLEMEAAAASPTRPTTP